VPACECVTTNPALMASLRPVAAVVQIEWPPVVTALTEGGLLYSATVCGAGRQAGRQAAGQSIHNSLSTGWVLSFQFHFFFVIASTFWWR